MNLRPFLQKKYPTGSHGGQCTNFCHELVDFPSVGDLYTQKKRAVQDFGILVSNLVTFQIGDIVITSEGVSKWQELIGKGNGHAFLVADMDKDFLYPAESNFALNEKVSYGRKVPKNSPKIYGVIRGDFKFAPPVAFPLHIKTTFFMQYQKQWNSGIFGELVERVKTASHGQVIIDPHPLYTYEALKNWWYKAYGSDGNEFYKVIDKAYYDEIAMPLAFPDSKLVIWAINKQQWQGAVFNQPNSREVGWYYRPSNPFQCVICCEEDELSPINFGTKMFSDFAFHEMSHAFFTFGRKDQADFTHDCHYGLNGKVKNLDDIFRYIDPIRLALNL